MKYELRDYQKKCSDAAVEFFKNDKIKGNGIIVAATGSGKSVIVADIAHRLDANVLVFCPSKELVEQDYEKMRSYGVECSMYSASVGKKEISRITFATIASAKNHPELFEEFDYIMVDEAHNIDPQKGMYKDFFKRLRRKVVGLTATPYRLESRLYKEDKDGNLTRWMKGFDRNLLEEGEDFVTKSKMTFVTNAKPCFFNRVLYCVDTREMKARGYMSDVRYFNLKPPRWDNSQLLFNKSGSDYSEYSMQWMFKKVEFDDYLVGMIRRLLHPKSGVPRNGILVFVSNLEMAEIVRGRIRGSHVVDGEMNKKEREKVINGFKSGEIKVLINCNCLSTGFDYPELDTVIMARPTASLALYTQIVGRCVRPSGQKESWYVDLCGNAERFGRTDELDVKFKDGSWGVYRCDGIKLTDVWIR